VTHTLASDLLLRHLHTAVVADDVLVTDSLVLTAVALPVLHGTEDALAEQTIAFGFISTVVNGFGFQDLSV
jgi:hypothetical protein